uniref:NADH-ubiquinone oxidoreductase chain 2 n=1 Tax=Cecidomyiidae sp. 3 LC-2017 TaxID=2030135 RepID=A0A343LA41_9DIPT|nr:NADH dehydrogenase subunit 2 [Cecidomyiidae sp. 3 LC-2017]
MNIMMLIISTLMVITSTSWFNLWIWLEINLFIFIVLLLFNKYKSTIESSLIYFLIQTISSIFLLFFVLLTNLNYYFYIGILTPILLKLGVMPFHFWLTIMIMGVKYKVMYLLLTWQKINPLILLMYSFNMNFIYMFIIFNSLFSMISSFNFCSFKKILIFSSINQLSWLMFSMIFNKILKIYSFYYFFLMFIIVKMLKQSNLNFLNQIYNNKMNLIMSLLMLNFLSLAGIPPFLGFVTKLIMLIKFNSNFIMVSMIMISIFMVYIYIRSMISAFLMKMPMLNLKKNLKSFKNLIILSLLNAFLIMYLMIII